MKSNYKNLIDALPIAYAYHRMIFDENGDPCDYVFIEVNTSFEQFTKLKASDIVGRRVTEVLPDIRKGRFDWVQKYGEVVKSGKGSKFDQYAEPQGKWFRVHAYCPKKDHFVSLFFDITDIARQTEEQSAIYSVLDEFVFEVDEFFRVEKVFTMDEAKLFLPKEKIIGKSISDLFPKHLSTAFVDQFEKARANNKKERFSYKLPNDETWYQIDVKFFKSTRSYIASVCNVTEQKQLRYKLLESETLFESIFNQAPYGIAVGRDYQFISHINPMFEKILGRTKEELTNLSWTQITHPDDLVEDLGKFSQFKAGLIESYSMKKRFVRPDGSFVWVNMTVAPLFLEAQGQKSHLCMIKDVTEHIEAQKKLHESERSKAVFLSHFPGLAYRCKYDRDWTMEFVSDGCYALTGYKPEALLFNRELSFNDLISPYYRDILSYEWKRVLAHKEHFRYEYEIATANGERKWVLEYGQGIYDEKGEVEALEGIIIDVSEQKNREAQIQYMSDHDNLTGLYNRRYFEQEAHRLDKPRYLPLSIIVADINGLRLINDAFGFYEGDNLIRNVADILKKCARKTDIPTRIGGDEFCIFLPNTDNIGAQQIAEKIKNAYIEYNISHPEKPYDNVLSIGYGTKSTLECSFAQVIKEAEATLRNRKLLSRKSTYSAIISSITATMFERSQETEEHAERLAELSIMIGGQLGLSQKELDELRLFAMLHDIGKVGIDDRILNKPGALSSEEWMIMKSHPEMGYRIAMASPELEPIAEYILSHHERYDGKGYPQGLKGEDIPLLARILAIADSFDAMTEDRVYRKAMSKQAAIKEIKTHAGTQFDPDIARIFVNSIA